MLNVYIGYDRNEAKAWDVCAYSLKKHASIPVNVIRLDQDWLRRIGLYRRTFFVDGGQKFDTVDGKPFSTDFSFTRFLVPALQPSGWALFCDSDFLWREDVAKLPRDNTCAVMCAKHQFAPKRGAKMRGQVQEPYFRKNWSSLMLWNCDHALSQYLTPFQVNTAPGQWLHGLKWLTPADIGSIDLSWNWLDGEGYEDAPNAVHFTKGTPDMPGYEDSVYASEWRDTLEELRAEKANLRRSTGLDFEKSGRQVHTEAEAAEAVG